MHISNESLVKELFLGRKVISASGSFLTLDDGRGLEVVSNEGCVDIWDC